jgi:hypothetical protein
MMIHSDKCQELSLPSPKGFDTQYSYVLSCIVAGHNINTRLCRYIGIHNLHSIIPKLKKKKIPFTLEHGRVLCLYTKQIPPHPVDIVYMTQEQLQQHLNNKKAA